VQVETLIRLIVKQTNVVAINLSQNDLDVILLTVFVVICNALEILLKLVHVLEYISISQQYIYIQFIFLNICFKNKMSINTFILMNI